MLELDPSNVRAGLSIALHPDRAGPSAAAAIARLDELAGRAPAADVGLAYALAGQRRPGVEILEAAARAPGATARTRQNLALAYAMAGDWRRARAVAAQDISPADLDARHGAMGGLRAPRRRLRPGSPALLGVTPVEDPGQPVRLALAPAEAAPAPVESRAAFAPRSGPSASRRSRSLPQRKRKRLRPSRVPTAQSYQPAPVAVAEAEAEAPAPAAESAPVRLAAAPEADDAGPPAPILPPQEARNL